MVRSVAAVSVKLPVAALENDVALGGTAMHDEIADAVDDRGIAGLSGGEWSRFRGR